jgi:hypothetical protein
MGFAKSVPAKRRIARVGVNQNFFKKRLDTLPDNYYVKQGSWYDK